MPETAQFHTGRAAGGCVSNCEIYKRVFVWHRRRRRWFFCIHYDRHVRLTNPAAREPPPINTHAHTRFSAPRVHIMVRSHISHTRSTHTHTHSSHKRGGLLFGANEMLVRRLVLNIDQLIDHTRSHVHVHIHCTHTHIHAQTRSCT